MASLPNLRRLFASSRTETEDSAYSRAAFYNLIMFVSSVALFSLIAQRMSNGQNVAGAAAAVAARGK